MALEVVPEVSTAGARVVNVAIRIGAILLPIVHAGVTKLSNGGDERGGSNGGALGGGW